MKIDTIGNPNQRTLCALVLDASGSMNTRTSNGRTRLEELNLGIESLYNDLMADPVASDRVVLSIIVVGGPSGGSEVLMEWTDVKEFVPFPLSAGGTTPLGEGMLKALDLVEKGKQRLKNDGVGYLRPWIMIITDGEPTDSDSTWLNACNATKDAEAKNKCVIFPIAVDGANTSKLNELTSAKINLMNAVKFNELFLWLSASLSAASSSTPGATIQLPKTDPWAGVKL